MKRVSGLHVVVSGLADEEEEKLPPKNGTSGNGASRPPLDRAKLTRLLKERRYEEALDMLLKARQQAPDDPTVSRSVRLLKDKLTIKFSEVVGSLDHTPRCTIPDAALSSLSLSFEERGVLALVDGIATFGDIVDASPHGKFATYRALATFLDKGIVARGADGMTSIPAAVVANRRPALSPVHSPTRTPPPPPVQDAELEPPAPAPEPPPVARRAPTRFAEPAPPAPAPEAELPAPPPPPAFDPGPLAEMNPSTVLESWEDIDPPRDPREETQPMFNLAALVAAGAVSATLAPGPAPAAQAPSPPQAELPPPQVPSKPGVDYDALFERATRAYVRRSYDEAMILFEEYLAKRPDDRRALHNLEQLRKRRKGS
ncbi:MAG TPA: hypothetical protein VND93_13980 [Myxococcales bacterium]|jgi:hypothetical protein|nr:hypothetical protein [Myxococcales bacterium]